MHRGEERVTEQFERSREKKRKEMKRKEEGEQTHKKLGVMDTDGGRHRMGAKSIQI